jgi:hypothetical protein
VSVKVKAGRGLTAAQDAGGFFVIAELVGAGDSEPTQRAATRAVSGTSAVLDGETHEFTAGTLIKRPLRLYVFRRTDTTGRDLSRQESRRDDLIGVATIPHLDRVTDRGRFVSFADVPVWSLPELRRHADAAIDVAGAVDAAAAKIGLTEVDVAGAVDEAAAKLRHAEATLTSSAHEIAERLGVGLDGSGGDAANKIINAAFGDASSALAGRLDVDLAVLLRGAPEPGQRFNMTTVGATGTAPALASPAEMLADSVAAALDGWGTDNVALATAAASLRAGEARKVRAAFRARFNADLVGAVRDDTQGSFGDALVRLFTRDRVAWRASLNSRAMQAARQVHAAIDGFGTNDELLISALTHGDVEFNRRVAFAYQRFYNRDIVEDIEDDTSGSFRTLMVRLVRPSHRGACEDV